MEKKQEQVKSFKYPGVTLTDNSNRENRNSNTNCFGHIHNCKIGNYLEKHRNKFVVPLQFLNSIHSFVRLRNMDYSRII